MLNHTHNNSVLTVSSPDSNFTPRREFVRDNHVSSTFALLALAGAGYLRLSSFPPEVVRSLASFAQRLGIRGYKEDKEQALYEFDLERKPWSNSKSIDSEKLFLDLLTIVCKHGYRFMSTIDYGREQDDRLTIVFSRPTTQSISPDSRSNSPIVGPAQVRIPFALSFPSATVLRVLNPPLNSTPAILQGVRSAWPRGVISEKKVAEGCFEFKLKGYKWFQEDTFATDSLQHIMSLLNSMDHYAFTLLTSISLSGNRSRVRDIWVFLGPPQDPPSDSGTSSVDLSSPRGVTFYKVIDGQPGTAQRRDGTHTRAGSAPVGSPASLVQANHSRSVTDPTPTTHGASSTMTSSMLKKNSSKLSSPSSPLAAPAMGMVTSYGDETNTTQRENSTCSVDMTGVGTAALRELGGKHSLDIPSRDAYSSPYPDRPRTGEILYSTPMYNNDSSLRHPPGAAINESSTVGKITSRDGVTPPTDVPQSVYGQASIKSTDSTPPILTSSTAFRDSAFSSNTRYSHEIPITWTGGLEAENGLDKPSPSASSQPVQAYFASLPVDNRDSLAVQQPKHFDRRSTGPNLPGAWKPTPVQEEPEEVFGYDGTDDERSPPHSRSCTDPEKRDVDAARVASPVPLEAAAMRRSEAASFGMLRQVKPTGQSVQNPGQLPPNLPLPRLSDPPPPASSGGGWVLVNVESSRAKTDPMANMVVNNSRKFSGNSRSGSRSPQQRQQTEGQQGQLATSMSPIAKVIVAADAISPAVDESNATGFKKLFSRSKPRKRLSKSK